MKGIPGSPATTVDQNLDHVGGFAKVFRKVWDHPYWQDAERFRAWIDCILLARWRDGYVVWRGRRVFVPRGSFRTSERELVARWGRSRNWVRLFLAEGEEHGELGVKRDHSGVQITLLNYERYHGTGTSEGTTQGPPKDHPRTTQGPPLYREEVQDLEEVQEPTPVGPIVDNSVDNPSMPRMVAEVYRAFAAAAGTVSKCGDNLIPNRTIYASERVQIERALRTGVDSHVLAEYVREKTAEGARISSSPVGSANYALTAWWRERAAPKPRDAQRKEPEERPLRPSYYATASPLPERELSDEQNKDALGSIGGILKKLGLPSTGGKK